MAFCFGGGSSAPSPRPRPRHIAPRLYAVYRARVLARAHIEPSRLQRGISTFAPIALGCGLFSRFRAPRERNHLRRRSFLSRDPLILGWRRVRYLAYSRRLIARGYFSRKFTAKDRGDGIGEPPSGREVASAPPLSGRKCQKEALLLNASRPCEF